MNQKFDKKAYAISKVEEFRSKYPNLDVSSLVAPTYPTKLRNVRLSEKEMALLPFNPIVLSTICGSLFGDSSLAINKNYANARIQNRHSTRQNDWFMWKTLCILQEFINETSICWQEPDGYSYSDQIQAPPPKKNDWGGEGEILGKWKVTTKVNEKLTKLHRIICPSGKKQLQRFWLNHMNNYFLMALWLDDGSLSDARQGVISCNNTPIAQAKILANYICAVWEVECKVVEVASKATATLTQPVAIVIKNLDNLEKLLRIIAPIIPVPSMLYKVCLYPIESSRLQRWTSELKTLVRQEWHADIDQIYADLKTKREEGGGAPSKGHKKDRT